TTATTTEPPQPGGSITVTMSAELRGFDPTLATTSNTGGSEAQVMFAVYDKLLYADPASGGMVPRLAESMTTTDATTWTLKVRPGIKFTDGTPYDATAVKCNWDRHADPANNSPWGTTVKNITYQVLDPLTLKITLKSASGQFPRVVSDQLSFIGSPTAEAAAGNQAGYNPKPVGAGPFVLKEWVRSASETLDRNPAYWDSPRPYLDRLIFRTLTDEQQRLNGCKVGEGQVDFTTTPLTADSGKDSGNVVVSPSINSSTIYFNLKRLPFSDKNARQAVQLAIDVDQINKTLFNGILETPKSY